MRLGHRLGIALFAIVSGGLLGERYISRLPNHAGYWQVRVDDAVEAPLETRGRVVVIVVDGLRRDQAERMRSAQRLRERGQCRVSSQGDYTVSRPVYALLSTGLEADRSGSRNNDDDSPLETESVWEVATRAGLHVRASSHLPWWKQLFPRGFTAYRHTPEHAANVFAGTAEDDARFEVDLFHPLYVDEMGHEHGGASAEYAAAVARVDGEIGGLLDRLDLDRDDVILTADHGHVAKGGHGGEQPVLREVLACFAGPHVKPSAAAGALRPFDGRLTAPLVALFAGVPFPAHMFASAGEDHLDELFDLARLTPAFEADRRQAVARFRDENAKQLRGWGGSGTFADLYARERRTQHLKIALVALAVLGLLASRARRPRGPGDAHATAASAARGAAADAVWLLFTAGAFWLAHRVMLGDFDFTVINRKALFVPRAFAIATVATIAGAGVHRVLHGASLASRLLLALVVAMILSAGHVFVYGWPLGFPLPPQPMRYMPFFLPFVQVVVALAYGMVSVRDARAAR